MEVTNYTYRFRLNPNNDQRKRLGQHFGTCRFIYNHFLDRRNRLYRENKQGSSYYKDCAELTRLKKELLWIGGANSQSLQQELKNLDTAFNRFFKGHARFPKFHSKKRDKQSFRVPQCVTVEGDRIKFPKFREGIKIRTHRKIEGKIKFATISKNRAGQYFACICVERAIKKLKNVKKEVGVDLGIKNLATCSDGQVFENIKPYRTLERRLKHLHRNMNRTEKGSKGRECARRKLAKLYQKITDIRSNHLHQVSHRIISENQAIYLEDLNVSGMLRNRRLSKSIQDVSLYELVRQIEYKSNWYGRTVIKIGRFYPSSKTCNNCGFINESLTLSDRSWICPRCRMEHDRDFNAAANIYLEGKRTVGTTGIAGGEKCKTSARKQFSAKPETGISLQARASRRKR
jgi:putative transposase